MKLYPYLGFNGNCEEAINFYKEAFDGEIFQLGRYAESRMETSEQFKDKIMDARLKFRDILILCSDTMGEKDADAGNMLSLSIECDNVDQLEKVFFENVRKRKSNNANSGSILGSKIWNAYW
ncbi:MAG: VOC family protein [Ginsengibacter sp.]